MVTQSIIVESQRIKELEAQVKALREQVREAKRGYDKSEDDLKALQSVALDGSNGNNWTDDTWSTPIWDNTSESLHF